MSFFKSPYKAFPAFIGFSGIIPLFARTKNKTLPQSYLFVENYFFNFLFR